MAPVQAEGTSSSRARPVIRWHGLVRLAVSLVAGLVLLGLAIPQTIAAWNARDAATVLDKLNAGKPASESELATGAAALKRALSWATSARWSADLGFIEVWQALRLRQQEPQRPQLLADAERHLTAGLTANPADGSSWVQLAFVRQLRGAPDRTIATALMQSLDVAPYLRALWIYRAEMLLHYRRVLEPDEADSFRRQIRTIWSTGAPFTTALAEAALRTGEWGAVEEALSVDPAALAEFEKVKASLIPALRR